MRKTYALLGVIVIVAFTIFVGCNVNPFFGVGTEVDMEEPTVEVTSHKSGDYVSSTFTLRGTCSDNIGVKKVIVSIKKTNFSQNASINGNEWELEITVPEPSEGDKLIDVYAYDERTNRAYTRVFVTVDDGLPTVKITEPVLKTVNFLNEVASKDNSNDFQYVKFFQNDTMRVSGYVDDKFIIQSTVIKVIKISDELEVDSITITKDTTLDARVDENSFPSKFTVYFDTTDTKWTDNSIYLLTVTTTDMAGNVNSSQNIGHFFVDQSKDRPSGKISSPNMAVTFPGSAASGTLWDDDGLKGYYWYLGKTANTNWSSWGSSGWISSSSMITVIADNASGYVDLSDDSPTLSSWQLVTPDIQGDFNLYIVPIDINDLSSSAPITKTFSLKKSDVPVLDIVGPDPTQTQSGTIDVLYTANAGTDKLITEILYRIEGITTYPSATTYLSIPIDPPVNSLISQSFQINTVTYTNDVSHDLIVSVFCRTDDGTESQISKRYFKADNNSPEIAIDFPLVNDGLNGLNEISGIVSDDWSGVKKIFVGYFTDLTNDTINSTYDTEQKLESATTVTPTLNRWFGLSTISASWKYNFDTSIITSTVKNPYFIYVAVVDKVGNVGYTSKKVYIDQELDRPTATIVIPENSGITFPESTAIGECGDDDGLNYIYWYVGKADPTSDHLQWGSYTSFNANAGRFDLSGNKPKNYSWQITTPKGTGDFKLYIMPVDIYGKSLTSSVVRNYKQRSIEKPEVIITAPDPTKTYSGTVDLKITAKAGEGKFLDKVIYKIAGDATQDGPVIVGNIEQTTDYTISFNINNYVDSINHDVRVTVQCSNKDGEESQLVVLNLKGDNTAPTVAITSPAINAKLNGSWTISGSLSDDWAGVKTLYIGYFTAMNNTIMNNDYDTEAKLEANIMPDTLGSWTKISNPSVAWSYSIDTTQIASIPAHNLYVAAVDNVGNVSYTNRVFDINQDYDKPESEIYVPGSGEVAFPGATASGIATDDDGIGEIYLLFWETSRGPYPTEYFTWSGYNLTDASGDLIVNFSSNHPTSYSWQAKGPSGTGEFIIAVKVIDKNGLPQDGFTEITYFQQTSDVPVVSITEPDPMNTYSGNINVVVNASGGTDKEVVSIYYWINNSSDTTIDSGYILEGPIPHSFVFDTTPYITDQTHDVKITVRCVNDENEQSQPMYTVLRVDNVEPATTVSSPISGSGLNGVTEIIGSSEDDYAGIKTLYFGYFNSDPTLGDFDTESELDTASVDTTTDIALGKWHKVPFTKASWSYGFYTTKLTDKSTRKLYIATVDKVGNVAHTNIEYYIDQDLDKPNSTINTPTVLPPTFPGATASGDATDDDGIQSIYYFIGKNSPPVDYHDWSSVTSDETQDGGVINGNGAKSVSWNFTTPAGEGEYTINIMTVDINGVEQNSITTRTFHQYSSTAPSVIILGVNASQNYSGSINVTFDTYGGAIYDVDEIHYRISSSE